jgi:hypothetical protein
VLKLFRYPPTNIYLTNSEINISSKLITCLKEFPVEIHAKQAQKNLDLGQFCEQYGFFKKIFFGDFGKLRRKRKIFYFFVDF